MDKPKLSHETIQQTLSNSLRLVDKELGDTKKVMEDAALQLSAFTKEAVANQFDEARLALEKSVEKSRDTSTALDKYTKGACMKAAEKIRGLETESELLDIGKTAVEIMLQLNEEGKIEDAKERIVSNKVLLYQGLTCGRNTNCCRR